MGCGGSKGSHDDDGDDQSLAGLPPRPVVCSRVEEIKRRSTSMFRSCGTKKVQLANGDFPVNGSKEDGQRSVSSSLPEDDGEREAVMIEAPEEIEIESGTTTLSPIKVDGSGGSGEEEMEERERGSREEEGYGRASGEEVGLMVIPGSPSFRGYCTTTDDDVKNDDATTNSLQSDQTDAENSQLSNSNQGFTPVKKDKKGRGFRRAIMDTLMVIKSSPSTSSQAGA